MLSQCLDVLSMWSSRILIEMITKENKQTKSAHENLKIGLLQNFRLPFLQPFCVSSADISIEWKVYFQLDRPKTKY